MKNEIESVLKSLKVCSCFEGDCAKCDFWGSDTCRSDLMRAAVEVIEEIMPVEPAQMKKVRINTHGNPMPERHGEWVDLFTAEDVTMEPFEYREIDLGVSMELPEGYYAEIVPRSLTCKKYGVILANLFGVIDHAYCGDNDRWCFPAVAIGQGVYIPRGTRIAQFRIVPQNEPFEFEQVESLGNRDRGGIGSTGN